MGIIVRGTGRFVPEKILTNADLEKMVDTSDDWIQSRTGIIERHIADPAVTTSDMAAAAAKNALEMAKIPASSLDLIIVATATPDMFFPNTACLVQKKIGAGQCPAFDLSAACSGLLYTMEVACSMLRANDKYRRALIVGAEKLSSIVDWTDRSTCVLFGDAASAMILEKTDETDSSFLVLGKLAADGNYSHLITMPAGGSAIPATADSVTSKLHTLKMNGKETFKLAVNAMAGTSRDVLAESRIPPEQITWIIPHQANHRIIAAVAQRIGIPTDRVYSNIEHYGNTSSASIGICLDELNRAGKLHRGDMVLLAAFGSGMTWAVQLIRW